MSAMPMRRIDAPRRHPAGRRGTAMAARATRARLGWRFRASALRTGSTPMVRRDGYSGVAEAAAVIEQRPQLRVVPRRRLAANAAALAVVVIGVLMLSAVVLHTRLAERQGEIDRLERQVEAQHEAFDLLRQQRAELRSPTRLATAASDIGMAPATDAEFATVDPWVLAQVLASSGASAEDDGSMTETDPLDQVRRVRAAESGAEPPDLGGEGIAPDADEAQP
jgi:hypothetical protein